MRSFVSDLTPRLCLPLIGDHAQKQLVMNAALMRLESLVQARVVSRSTAAEPSAPADGDAYILPAGASGATWGGLSAGGVVRAEGGVWESVDMPEGALVLIDTAGTNPLRAEDLAALADLAQAAKAEPVLVLSAGGDASESAEQGQLFSEIGCERMVAAKIDAARRFGGLLAAAENGKLSFAGSGISPEIANGFEFTGADGLARLLMPQDMARAPKAAQNSPRRGAQGRKTEAAKRKKEIGSGA